MRTAQVLRAVRGPAPDGSRAHDAWTAAGVLAIGLVFLLAGVDRIWGDAPWSAGIAAQVVLLVVACSLLLVKRDAPVGVLLAVLAVAVVDAALGQQLGVLFAAIDALYSAARFASPRAVRVLGWVIWTSVVGSAGIVYAATADERVALLVGLQVFAVAGTSYWWGTAVRRAHEATMLAEQRTADQVALADAARAEALRIERVRTAGDVHDTLSGHLSAIAIHAEALLSAPRVSDDPVTATALATIRESSRTALLDLQSLVILLRRDVDRPARTAPARLSEPAELLRQADRLGVDVSWGRTELDGVPAAVDQVAYRIVQEALVNAARHAPGCPVTLTAEARDDALRLQLDNPTAPDAPAGRRGAGTGVLSMVERAASVGGRLEAGRHGDVWTVRAELPLTPSEVVG